MVVNTPLTCEGSDLIFSYAKWNKAAKTKFLQSVEQNRYDYSAPLKRAEVGYIQSSSLDEV